MNGYDAEMSSYFLLDFSNDKSIVWTSTCMQTVQLPESGCFNAPTYLFNFYNNVTASISTFTQESFGGYLVDGDIYLDTITYDDTFSRIIEVYAGSLVTEDAWLFGQQGDYGILGYGPNSSLWNQFINPDTGTATYTIALADPATAIKSNITLGAADLAQLSDLTSVNITADASGVYSVDTFGFGTVYT